MHFVKAKNTKTFIYIDKHSGKLYYYIEKGVIPMLTKSEQEVMHLLWSVDEPLTSTEIVNRSVGASWKKTYVNLLVNSLLEKKMIEISGVKQTGRNYSRTFRPIVKKEEYFVDCITDSKDFKEDYIPEMFCALVKNTKNKDIIDKLQVILNEAKEGIDE